MTGFPERALRITPDMLLSRRVDFERRMRRLPPVTLTILAVLGAFFVVETVRRATESPVGLIAIGALVREGVLAGQYWRLVSATLLHGGLDHLLGNAVAIFILGMVCEHAFGARQFLLLYALSAVGGSLVSMAVSPGPSVGASGAAFGLQGAAVVLFRRYHGRLLVRDRRIGMVLLVWAVYTIVGGLATPYIDNGAHLGGALTGALFARALHPVVLEPMPEAAATRVDRGLWLLAAVLAYTFLGLLS